MKVKLRRRAFLRGVGIIEPGIYPDWPDDVPLPSSAEKTDEPVPEPETSGEEPVALKDVDVATGRSKKKADL